ncbi:MAG: class I SAM-dependent methyltransferase [Nitrospirae bacterium]|nr:class I SAM-dependent methyltransferase [Nitrospirota bacterium]MBE0428075.1 class I SAM-dependent methyltransferase [Nitrospirota bacterium]
MNERPEWLKRENRDWEKIYSEYHLTEIPWHSDKPDQELIDLIENKEIKPRFVLDVGCGSGTDAIYLALIGCEVTAIDISREAIRIARERAEKAKVRVNFIADDFTEFDFIDQRFDFINDRGCFHHINPRDREKFAVKINDLLKNNGFYFLRCWSDKEAETERGPYRLSKDEIRNTFSKFFKVGTIEDFRFGGRGARGYACLMRKE